MNVTSAQLSQEVKDIIWRFANKIRANISDANLHLAIALSLYKWKLEGVKYESLISNQFIYEVMGECLDITDYLTQDEINLLLDNYLEVVDFCLHFVDNSPKSSSEYFQPVSLTRFCSQLANFADGSRIYNPFAGIGTYAIENPACDFFGEELSQKVYLLLLLNLLAHGKTPNYDLSNSFVGCEQKVAECDGVIATPPFNIKDEHSEFWFANTVIENLKEGGKMLFIFPLNFCYGSHEEFELRKYLIEHRYLTHVIQLPAIFLPVTRIASCIVVAEKCRHDDFLVVDGSSYLSKSTAISNDFKYEELLEDIKAMNPSCCKRIKFQDAYQSACDLRPARLLWQMPEIENPTRLGDIVSIAQNADMKAGEMAFGIGELSTDWLQCNIQLKEPVERVRRSVVVATEGLVVANVLRGSFALGKVLADDEGKKIAIGPSTFAFTVDSKRVILPYLIQTLLGALVTEQVQAYSKGATINMLTRRDLLDITIPLPSLQEQQRIVKEAENAYLQQLGIAQVGSDLGHMLGTPFSKISFALLQLEESESLSARDRKNLHNLKEIFEYADRLVKVSGNLDIKSMNRRDICLYDFIQSYISKWDSFGSETFKVEFDADDNAHTALVNANEDALSIMFDCLFDNAHRHGFGKNYHPDNEVTIVMLSELHDGKPYIRLRVGNNGKPMEKGFEVKDYIARGRYVSGSGRSGLGGYHVNAVVESMGGEIDSLISIPGWTAFEFLIPQVVTDSIDTSKFMSL